MTATVSAMLFACASLLFGQEAGEPQPVTLRLAMWDKTQLAMQDLLIAEFSAKAPHISIDIEIPENYFGDIWTALESGEAYDVMWMNASTLAIFAHYENLLPISDLVEEDGVDLSSYPDALVDMYTHEGVLYGLPKDFDTIGLFYNVDMFDANGLDYPDDTWTWDDLKNAARAFTTGDAWGFAATLSGQTVVFNLIGQNGGRVLSEDGLHVLYGTPEACEALQFLYSFHEERISPDQATLDTTSIWELFRAQRLAMVYGGSWAARTLAGEDIPVDVAPLPGGKERSNTIHGLAYVIAASSEHPEEAWEFVKYLGSEEAHLVQSSTGAVISSRAGTQQLWVDSFGDEMDVQVFLDQVQYAKAYPVSKALGGWEYRAREVLQDAFRGNVSFPEACALAAEAGDAYIAEYIAEYLSD